MMGIFYLIVFVVILIIIYVYFYIIKIKFTHLGIMEGNIGLYKQQISELKRDYSLGYINSDEFKNINDELSRRILNSKSSNSNEETIENKNFVLLYKLLIPLILIFAFLMYGVNGRPNMPDFSLSSRINDEIPNIYWQLTLEDINKKIIGNPVDLEFHLVKANILTTLGKTQESIKIWEKVLELSGEDTKASHLLSYGEALVSQNIEKKSEYLISEKALEIFQKSSSLAPANSEVGGLSKYYLSVAALEQGNLDKAHSLWEEIKQAAPEETAWKESVLLNISKLQEKYSLNENRQILSMVDRLEKRLLENKSNSINDWKKLGRASLVLKQFQRAERSYRRAVELNNEDIEAIEGLAEARLYQNKKNTVVDKVTLNLFKKILSINQNHPLALWVISEDEVANGNKFKAIILLQKLIANLPQDSDEYILVLKRIEELQN